MKVHPQAQGSFHSASYLSFSCDLFSLMPGDLVTERGLQRSGGGTKGSWNPQKPSGRRMT